MAFSPSDAAFEGFRLTRERPGTVLALAIFQMVASALLMVAMVGLFGPEMKVLAAQKATPTADPNEAMAIVSTALKVDSVLLPAALLMMAVLVCTVYRAVLRPERSSFGGLRFGGDELRLTLLFAIFAVLWMAITVAIGIVIGLVGAVGAAAGGPGGALLAVVGALVALGVSVWVFVRLSLAAPMTFAERKLRVFESWSLTRGHFWALFGAYLIAFVMGLVVSLLGLAIFFGVAVAVGGGVAAISGVFQPDFSSFAAYLTPLRIAYLIVNAGISALAYAILIAPGAVAYRELARPTSIPDVFGP